MIKGRRSALTALVMNAKLTEKSKTATICAAILLNSFILISKRRARLGALGLLVYLSCFGLLRIM